MTEGMKEQKLTPEEIENRIKVLNKQIKQTKQKIDLMNREHEQKMKLLEIKSKYSKLREGTDKPEFVFRQEFYDVLLELDKINIDNYEINYKDAVSREKSSIKGLEQMIKETESKKLEVE